MKRLSVVIITFNEEKNIVPCLESVSSFADEIVVLDSHSADKTPVICRMYNARVIQRKFAGFGLQKQDAIAKANYEWVLQIDADERVSPLLAEKILSWKKEDSDDVAGYDVPFHFYFMGQRLRFGGCAPEYHIRLFKKDSVSYGKKTIHEGVAVHGAVRRMKGAIIHYSYESFSEYFDKFNQYTTLIAEEKYASGKRFHWWHIFRLPQEFILRYVLKIGFLDGLPGLVFALLSSYYAWMKHMKLWDIENSRK